MFLLLWNYLTGYVIIKVTGFSVERFINLAAIKGIFIWDINPIENGATMKVSIKGFKYLKDCARKTKCSFVILKKCGLPFVIYKYKRRQMLAAGILLFVLGLYIMSSFVWTIEVTGNERVRREEVIAYCETIGIAPGRFKLSLDTEAAVLSLLSNFSDIAWASIKITGTNVEISIAETVVAPETIDRNSASDIIASKSGIITSIVVSSGTPMVKEKDIVKAGDILVSGEVKIADGENVLGVEHVKSQANITARVWYEIENEIPLTYSQKAYTGEVREDTEVIIGENAINFIRPNLPEGLWEKELESEKSFAIGDYKLPFSLTEYKMKEYIMEEKTMSPDEAKKTLLALSDEEAADMLPDEALILEKEVYYEEEEDKIKIKMTLTVLERIDEEKAFVPREENLYNE